MKKIIILFIFLLVLTGCQKKELKEINIGLSWIHEAQFAGLYAADQYGYYEDQGLKVNLIPYNYEDLAQELVNNKYDFVFLQTDTLLLAREKGLPVKAVFADYKIIPTVYFSKKDDNIIKPEDLINKTVGVAYSERYPLIAMLEESGISRNKVNIIEREYTYDKLASGEYDVEAGWVTDGDLVEQAIGEYNTISPYDYNINWYADLLSVTEDTIQNNSELVEKFLIATIKGWNKAIKNPDKVALLTQKYDPETEAEHLKFVLGISLPFIHTETPYLGIMDNKVFENTQNILKKEGVMKKLININNIFTNIFLEKIYNK